jgi:TfoX/Sxy family transcriptional regulator of competence genes
MNMPATTETEKVYAEIVRHLSDDPHVSTVLNQQKKRFGSSGELKYDGKMFAFHSRGRLIVKLPKTLVDSLIASGRGEPCVMGQERVMREWIVVGGQFLDDWPSLADQSKQFVSALRSGPDVP